MVEPSLSFAFGAIDTLAGGKIEDGKIRRAARFSTKSIIRCAKRREYPASTCRCKSFESFAFCDVCDVSVTETHASPPKLHYAKRMTILTFTTII